MRVLLEIRISFEGQPLQCFTVGKNQDFQSVFRLNISSMHHCVMPRALELLKKMTLQASFSPQMVLLWASAVAAKHTTVLYIYYRSLQLILFKMHRFLHLILFKMSFLFIILITFEIVQTIIISQRKYVLLKMVTMDCF